MTFRPLALVVFASLLCACGGVAAPVASTGSAPAKPTGSAAASGGAGLTKLSVAHSVASPGFWPLYMAADTGIFARNGLDVSVQIIPGATNAAAAMVSGQIQFAQFGGGAAMASAVNGSDLLILAVIIPRHQFVIYGGPDVKTPADLKGKKVGVVSLGGSEDHISVRQGLRYAGVDPDKDVSILAVGPERVAALTNGAVQAASLTPPDTLKAEAAGFHPVLNIASTGLPHLGQSSVSTRAYVSSHRDLTQKYVDSIVQGIAKLRQDRALAIDVLGKRIKSDDQQAMGVAYDYYTKEIYPVYPEPKPELFQDAVEELQKEDPKIGKLDVNTIIDASFVKNAQSREVAKLS
jgi:NitT/TauT family transport system substrate-binding protein